MKEELMRILEELVDERIDERVSYTMRRYDEYMKSGHSSSMTFNQYIERERELDRKWRLGTGAYMEPID